jgi:hypothetical protein
VTLVPALRKLGTMTLRSTLTFTLSLAALTQGCTGGTETGNPPFTGSLSYTGFSSEPERVGLRQVGTELTVRQAWLDLDEVTLLAGGGCGLADGASLTLPGIGVGDHAAGVHVVTRFEATSAAFCTLDLPFVRAAAPSGGPDELAGNSVLLRGDLADGTAFSIASRQTPVVELEAGNGGFRLEAEQARILLAFDFAAWLAGLDFAAAERLDGVISVDRERNVALLEAFEQRLSGGVSLHRDPDGDGTLEAGSQPIAEPR